jgi:putative transposase
VRVLVEQQQKQNKRILLTNNQRMRVASKAKRLNRKLLDRCTELFTPGTIMRWYRELIVDKYDGSKNRVYAGRPPITQEIVNLVTRFKEENPRWGYQKIRDQVVYLGHKISKSSVKNILIENGYDPEPDLTVRSTWHEFIKSHWDVLAACDFFTIEFLVDRKLIRCTVFFVIELASREVFFAPVKPQPDGPYMRQVAKILTDSEDGFLQGKRYLIHDRDPLYRTDGFNGILKSIGVKPLRLPARSPNLNSYSERFVKTVKSECLDHLILSSVKQLEYALEQFSAYYHHERIHQGVGRIIEPKHPIDDVAEVVPPLGCLSRGAQADR